MACTIALGCTESEESVGPSSTNSPDYDPELDSLRKQDERILRQISRVEIWTTKEMVIEILGEPGEPSENEWYYAVSPLSGWIDDGVQVKGYRIYFENGKVKRRDTDSASYYFIPNPDG